MRAALISTGKLGATFPTLCQARFNVLCLPFTTQLLLHGHLVPIVVWSVGVLVLSVLSVGFRVLIVDGTVTGRFCCRGLSAEMTTYTYMLKGFKGGGEQPAWRLF